MVSEHLILAMGAFAQERTDFKARGYLRSGAAASHRVLCQAVAISLSLDDASAAPAPAACPVTHPILR